MIIELKCPISNTFLPYEMKFVITCTKKLISSYSLHTFCHSCHKYKLYKVICVFLAETKLLAQNTIYENSKILNIFTFSVATPSIFFLFMAPLF